MGIGAEELADAGIVHAGVEVDPSDVLDVFLL
jgi:hypothetical protein